MILRAYQQNAVDAAWQSLCTLPGNPVVVSPTGSGKSLLIAALCRDAVQQYSGRVIVLAHRRELLEQNADKIERLLPGMDIGIYSAGLKSRDTDHDIVVAGIQSIYRRAHELGSRNLIICDECHLLPEAGEGMYQQFLKELRTLNTRCRLIGLTATPYRLSEGKLCKPTGLLNHVCYNASIKQLVADGYLCRLVSTASNLRVDTSGLHRRQGEFIASELESLFDAESVIQPACNEILSLTHDRHSCLIFCSGVKHAEHVAKLLGGECVTGETPPLERAALLRDFREGRLKYLTNCEVLTTGFDAPCIDFIAVLRATESAGLFAQMLGRGMRTDPSKTDCAVADFGNNLERHGPLDSETYGEKIKGTGDGEQPMKTCPSCGESVPISATECECGWLFPRENKPRHDPNATGGALFVADIKPTVWNVVSATAALHRGKEGKDNTMRISYQCEPLNGGDIEDTCVACGHVGVAYRDKISTGRHDVTLAKCGECGETIRTVPRSEIGNLSTREISEWVCCGHSSPFAARKAVLWWQVRSESTPPATVEEAVDLFSRGACRCPSIITTVPEGKWVRILSVEFHDERPEEWDTPKADVSEWEATEGFSIPF